MHRHLGTGHFRHKSFEFAILGSHKCIPDGPAPERSDGIVHVQCSAVFVETLEC